MTEYTYSYDGLRLLNDSLNATGVLSEDYRRNVLGWALMACSEAYEAGRKDGVEQGKKVPR